jgi:hypothetical protein
MPMAGWPSTPAARPVSSTTPFLDRIAPAQRRSTSPGFVRVGPSTMPALAAKSLIVSVTLRGAFVSRSMISTAGTTHSVAASTCSIVSPAPASGFASTNASSTSTRGAMKRASGIVPGAKNMSSISGA